MNEQELRSASLIVDRVNWAKKMGLGVSFDGARDLWQVLGYPNTITPAMHRDRYRRGGIAKRIVEAYPQATWRGGGKVTENEDSEATTQFELLWEYLEDKHNIWSRCKRVDILSRQGQYAVMLIGAPGNVDQPMKKGGPDDLLFLRPVHQDDAVIEKWDENTNSPRFGLPLMYQIRINENQGMKFNASVHYTRILHVAEGILDNDIYGIPCLEAPWNLILDLEKVSGGGSEAYWLRANPGLHFDVDKDMIGASDVTDDELVEWRKQLDNYRHKMDRVLRTRGVEVKQLPSEVSDFSSTADALMTQIAGTIGMPKRILTGSEMGQLASGQDRDNWDSQVQDRRTGHAEPNLIRPLVKLFMEYGFLPVVKKFIIDWPTVGNLTEEEKAKSALTWAQANQAYGDVVLTRAEIRQRYAGLDDVTPEELEASRPEPVEPPTPTAVKKVVAALASGDIRMVPHAR